MNPGKLDRLLTVLARDEMRGTAGGVAITYAEEGTVWAEEVERSGQESRSSDGLRSQATITWRIRYRASLTTQHRIVYDDVTYDILSVDPEGRRRFQLVRAQTVEGRA